MRDCGGLDKNIERRGKIMCVKYYCQRKECDNIAKMSITIYFIIY